MVRYSKKQIITFRQDVRTFGGFPDFVLNDVVMGAMCIAAKYVLNEIHLNFIWIVCNSNNKLYAYVHWKSVNST